MGRDQVHLEPLPFALFYHRLKSNWFGFSHFFQCPTFPLQVIAPANLEETFSCCMPDHYRVHISEVYLYRLVLMVGWLDGGPPWWGPQLKGHLGRVRTTGNIFACWRIIQDSPKNWKTINQEIKRKLKLYFNDMTSVNFKQVSHLSLRRNDATSTLVFKWQKTERRPMWPFVECEATSHDPSSISTLIARYFPSDPCFEQAT